MGPRVLNIENESSDGLLGKPGSQSYILGEIERHLHSNEKFFGLAGTPNAEIHRADRITLKPEPFVANAGNDDWGAWLQIMGSGDTPALAGSVKYDFHEMLFVSHEHNSNVYAVQIVGGESADIAAKVAAEEITEIVFITGGGNTEVGPITIKSRRSAAGVKCWVRVWAKGQNTSTLSFYFGIHEYEG